jgi:hypothetical protein
MPGEIHGLLGLNAGEASISENVSMLALPHFGRRGMLHSGPETPYVLRDHRT